jgi:hypothetical protein
VEHRNALILLAVCLAGWAIVGLIFRDELASLSDGLAKPAQSDVKRAPAGAAPPPKPVDVAVHSQAGLTSRAQDLLYAAQYDELEQLLEQLRQDAARDPATREFALLQAYFAFENTESRMREELDAWLQVRPESAAALSARSRHRIEAAWDRRGGGYSAEVAKDAMADFERLLGLARQDAEAALAKVPDHPVAWSNLIRATCGTEGASGLTPLIERLQEQAPASYTAHRVVLNFLQPRWGGSYEVMARYAEMAQAERARNARLEVLRGYPHWAAGEDARTDKDHAKAVEHYNRALAFGEEPDFLSSRSRALRHLFRFKEALADMTARHEHFASRESKEALDEAQAGMREDAYKLHRANQDAEAIKAYQAFLEVWPDDEDVLFYFAQVSSRMNHYNEALRAYRRVIEMNPTRFEAVQGADHTLAREKRWNEILPLWDAYLARVPDSAQGWFEQGGTYYQMGDLPKAYANVVKACELKFDQACAWKQRLSQHPGLKG